MGVTAEVSKAEVVDQPSRQSGPNGRGAGKVSVIICAFTEQRWDELLRAVNEAACQEPAPDEIIVVIDHNPALLERATRALPEAKVIPNRESQGLSGGRNSGVAAAAGDILVFMDEDAWPQPGWLAALLDAYQGPQVLGVGGAIDPDWENGRPAWFPPEFDWVVGSTYLGMPERPSPVRNLIGANMSFRRSAFAGNGFSDGIGRVGSFPAGGEETEFSIRIRQRQPEGVLMYLPQARVHHRVPANRARFAYFAARCYAEGLSKAVVTRLVGARDGLGNERTYTFKTLPRGVLRGVGQALRGDLSGLARAGAIVAGLGLTTAGYLVGKLRLRLQGRAYEKSVPVTELKGEFTAPEGAQAAGEGEMPPPVGGDGSPSAERVRRE
jgi:glycosyltransferase involved in cell wall biosynthesis